MQHKVKTSNEATLISNIIFYAAISAWLVPSSFSSSSRICVACFSNASVCAVRCSHKQLRLPISIPYMLHAQADIFTLSHIENKQFTSTHKRVQNNRHDRAAVANWLHAEVRRKNFLKFKFSCSRKGHPDGWINGSAPIKKSEKWIKKISEKWKILCCKKYIKSEIA